MIIIMLHFYQFHKNDLLMLLDLFKAAEIGAVSAPSHKHIECHTRMIEHFKIFTQSLNFWCYKFHLIGSSIVIKVLTSKEF